MGGRAPCCLQSKANRAMKPENREALMLTKGDEYPIHQTPEPIAYSGTDRNFYDRYFFNGYNWDGSVFFGCGLGVYPHLNVMDANFAVVVDGVQHNIHASRVLHMERLDTKVGPIAVEVIEPLQALRITVDSAEHDFKADITFRGRARALEEPRFTYRQGPRIFMDYTRMTQNGSYEGWIEVKGRRIEVKKDQFVGTRDRSWGIRPVGASDPQPVAPPPQPQFYWIWSPLNFENAITLYHINADAKGDAWNTAAVLCPTGGGEEEKMDRCWSDISFQSGSRHAKAAELHFQRHDGSRIDIKLTPKWNFYMTGLGYGNPDWNHGGYKGELAVDYDCFKTADIDTCVPPYLHIQAFVEAEMRDGDKPVQKGAGILEQLIIGPHAPSGFKDLLDMAP
jgi:hypothetical protein